jgi:hypothetical protein
MFKALNIEFDRWYDLLQYYSEQFLFKKVVGYDSNGNPIYERVIGEIGIQRWEALLSIIPEEGASLDDRLQAIENQIAMALPYSIKRLNEYTMAILSSPLSDFDIQTQVLTINAVGAPIGLVNRTRNTLQKLLPKNIIIKLL